VVLPAPSGDHPTISRVEAQIDELSGGHAIGFWAGFRAIRLNPGGGGGWGTGCGSGDRFAGLVWRGVWPMSGRSSGDNAVGARKNEGRRCRSTDGDQIVFVSPGNIRADGSEERADDGAKGPHRADQAHGQGQGESDPKPSGVSGRRTGL